MKKILAIALLVCSLLSLMLSNQAFADGPKPSPPKPKDPKPGGTPGHKDAPFDGGLILLVGAGVVYGLKKAHDSRQQGT
ncbi:PID-CTERM protein-sorting domain-containing protein [Mucilaginibacter aquariorum]|uniref:Signal peptidase n=1 Tax=Mucilaginibacter aquariorum TaxID=2967225 RepID=A0ABT1SWL3_9SPHI|nr:hypothetical protein [Mucilaginibacter aquariorum]MCQ6956481.1 hypothetical protein [Mucilaginibacter aquariorum]